MPRLIAALFLIAFAKSAQAMHVERDVPYAEPALERQELDIYTPDGAQGKRLPVIFWIHGGGGQQVDTNPMSR